MDRLERLRMILVENPEDSFACYGLGMEYFRLGDLSRALAEFERLILRDPDYVAVYLQAGQVLESLHRPESAREIYRQGIDVATRRGELRARGELLGAMEALG